MSFDLFVDNLLFSCLLRQESGSTISPSRLFAGSGCPLLESDWPLVLDWNWLHKACNNGRLLVFCRRCWRSVGGLDAAVTTTARFYISVLSNRQISKIRPGLWSQRYWVSNWLVLIRPALVCMLRWMRTWTRLLKFACGSAESSCVSLC